MTTSDDHHPQQNEKSLPPPSADVVSSVKRRLWEETAHGFGNVVGNLRDAWYTGENAVFFTREEERFKKYIPPFQYGLAASVFLFANFRVTGNPRFQQWHQKLWHRIRPASKPKEPPPPQPTMGYLETKRKNDVEKSLKSLKVLTDFFISLTVGTSGTLFLLETTVGKDLRGDFEEAPLVAGRSLVADEVCPGFLELYQSDPRVRIVLAQEESEHQIWRASIEDPNLRTFSTFLKNCQRRKNHEDRQRKGRQRGIVGDTETVIIPYTGVQ